MKPHSLRLRLVLISAATIVLALLVAGVAISTIFASHVERSFKSNLEAHLARLVALVDANPEVPALLAQMADPRFEVPGSGLYWQVSDVAGPAIVRSRSLWETVLPLPAAMPADGTALSLSGSGPEDDRLMVLARRLAFERDAPDGDRTLDLLVAEDTSVLDAANAAFRGDLMRALTVLALALVAATWLQVLLGLSPLGTIKRGIAAISSGRAKSLEGNFPSEVMPLISEVNDLLEVQERSIGFARERSADLAHGLKTSLTLLVARAYELRRKGDDGSAEAIEKLVAEMSDTIDHQLRLSRLRHRSRSDFQSTGLLDVATKVIAALRLTPDGETKAWRVEVPATLSIALDRMDLTELLGVLLENAAQWSNGAVQFGAEASPTSVTMTIADDGPGLDEAVIATLGQRGRRLDETRSGSGLGLAIAREIVALNHGSLDFGRAKLGGLEVRVSLPR